MGCRSGSRTLRLGRAGGWPEVPVFAAATLGFPEVVRIPSALQLPCIRLASGSGCYYHNKWAETPVPLSPDRSGPVRTQRENSPFFYTFFDQVRTGPARSGLAHKGERLM